MGRLGVVLFIVVGACGQAPETPHSLNEHGAQHFSRGEYREAGELFARALERFSAETPCPERAMAITMGNLSAVKRVEARFTEAEALGLTALRMLEKTSGPLSAGTAWGLSNLAEVYSAQADHAKAEQYARHAVALAEQMGSAQALTDSLRTVASVLTAAGQHSAAAAVLEQVLQLMHSPETPPSAKLAVTLNNLAAAQIRMGRPREAELCARRAVDLLESLLGPQHPTTAAAFNNLGQAARFNKNYVEAERLYHRALESWKRSLGPWHPNVSKVLANLADLWHERGRIQGASVLYKKAIEVAERAYGPDHPETLRLRERSAEVRGPEMRATP